MGHFSCLLFLLPQGEENLGICIDNLSDEAKCMCLFKIVGHGVFGITLFLIYIWPLLIFGAHPSCPVCQK